MRKELQARTSVSFPLLHKFPFPNDSYVHHHIYYFCISCPASSLVVPSPETGTQMQVLGGGLLQWWLLLVYFHVKTWDFYPFSPLLDLKRVESMVRTRLSKLLFLCF
jgi:hypothetical protein